MPTIHRVNLNQAGGIVAGSYLLPVLEAAGARGVDLRDLARAAGMPPDALSLLPDSISAPDYATLLNVGAQLASDPHFGLHVGECVRLGTYNV
jgi:hypothetical protein